MEKVSPKVQKELADLQKHLKSSLMIIERLVNDTNIVLEDNVLNAAQHVSDAYYLITSQNQIIGHMTLPEEKLNSFYRKAEKDFNQIQKIDGVIKERVDAHVTHSDEGYRDKMN